MSKNKYSVTFTFPTEELLEDFCAVFCDGGGENVFWYDYDNKDNPWNNASFDYSRCFPAWGWKEGEPKFIDVIVGEEEQ